jgi:hypothetical protein
MSKLIDKSKWSNGPWNDEPDHVEFRHKGVPCILHRNSMGAWCGYAAVEPGHPWHGLDYQGRYDDETDKYVESPASAVEVHGGLTYADKCQGDICHVAQPGEPDDVWWFGFDCGHGGDTVPGMMAHRAQFPALFGGGEYRDLAYVRAQAESLADQLIAARSAA